MAMGGVGAMLERIEALDLDAGARTYLRELALGPSPLGWASVREIVADLEARPRLQAQLVAARRAEDAEAALRRSAARLKREAEDAREEREREEWRRERDGEASAARRLL